MRGGKFISVNHFPAQEQVSSKSRHILNFRVMTMRDIKPWTCLSISIRKSAYLNVILIGILENQWPR